MPPTTERPTTPRTCPQCGRGVLLMRRNRSTGNPFLGCDTYPTCRYTEPLTAPPEEQAINPRLVEENLRLLDDVRKLRDELAAAEKELERLCSWYDWLERGLMRLHALMDPEYWDYDAFSLEVRRELGQAIEYLFGPEEPYQQKKRRLLEETREAISKARQDACQNPACLGCAGRLQAWLDPFQKRDIPCLNVEGETAC